MQTNGFAIYLLIMKKLKLFFSWQSDTKGNHKNISDSLIEACDVIRNEGEYDINYTESTWERSGSPIIEKTVMAKAKDCDIFVADLTPIDSTEKKLLPNPNVMLELGVAKSCLVDDVILLLFTGTIDAAKMPFDINHQRMSRFSKSSITDYVRSMAETAVQNPRHTSIFDNNDKFLYYDRNVRKNIASGKYLPNVYLENREVKQHLRDFVAPYPFCKLVLERCDMIETYRTNRNRRLCHREPFVFDVSEYKNVASEELLSNFYRRATELKDYINGKYNELHGNNSDYLTSSKYGRQVIHLQYVIGKLLLVTTSAGQGKTNLICDLVDNVLLKRDIPFVYLNGYEIDADHVEESFARAMLPTSRCSFDEAIHGLATYCKYKRSPVILIIDGLNENANPTVFARNLEVFLEAVLQYECIKVIMTCRTEYYDECFNLLDVAFKDRMIKIENLNQHLDEDERRRLLDNYFHYFNITAQLYHHIEERLCKDLLLLRIFCEANNNKGNLGFVHSIKREDLFTEYYELMTSKLIEKVSLEEGITLSKERVKMFIMGLVEYMITNNRFFNVPLSFMESHLSESEYKIFTRFLEENILLRRDLTPESKGLFGTNEMVNFTYDAFRDYLLSAYLSDHMFYADISKYKQCISDYTHKDHQLREGITPFLFVHSKIQNNVAALEYFSTFDWYTTVFEHYIWDVPNNVINDNDIKLVKKILCSDHPAYVAQNLIYFGRWKELEYPSLNIKLLLNHFAGLNDEELSCFLDKLWSDKPEKAWRREEKSQRTKMIESLEKVLDNEEICAVDSFHNLFELLLYISVFSQPIGRIVFMKYFHRYKNLDMLERVGKETQCSKLLLIIEEIKRRL